MDERDENRPSVVAEPPFEIRVARTGGFAGLRREWSIEVTDPDDVDRWRPLIEACPWRESGDAGVPDGFVYDFRAADLTAVVPENRLDGPWRRLAEEVRRAAD